MTKSAIRDDARRVYRTHPTHQALNEQGAPSLARPERRLAPRNDVRVVRDPPEPIGTVEVACAEQELIENDGRLWFRLQLQSACLLCEENGQIGGERICTDCQGCGETNRLQHALMRSRAERERCEKCEGRGRLPPMLCPLCRGACRREEERVVHLQVGSRPPGVHEIIFRPPGKAYLLKLRLTVSPGRAQTGHEQRRSWRI